MDEVLRRAIAFKALAEVRGQAPQSIYSYTASRFTPFSGSATSFYDFDAQAHVAGGGGNIYHHGTGARASFMASGTSFQGFDYSSGSHYNGSVSGNSVQLYDYATGKFYTYTG